MDALIYVADALIYVADALIYVADTLIHVADALIYVADALTYVADALTYVADALIYVADASTYVADALIYVADTLIHVADAWIYVADASTYVVNALTYVTDALCGGRFDLYGRRKLYKLCRPTATCLLVLYSILRLHNASIHIMTPASRLDPPSLLVTTICFIVTVCARDSSSSFGRPFRMSRNPSFSRFDNIASAFVKCNVRYCKLGSGLHHDRKFSTRALLFSRAHPKLPVNGVAREKKLLYNISN